MAALRISRLRPSAGLTALACTLLLAACGPSESGESAGGSPVAADPIPIGDAVAAVEGLRGDFTCADPVPRADDFAWVCEGSRDDVEATIHLFAIEVEGSAFGATLYVQAPDAGPEAAASMTLELARELVGAAVPEEWRRPASDWLADHFPDGGRTLDVPGAGITASVQPLAALQWYVELYELDGVESRPASS